MIAIIGLGNPDKVYEKTHHNMGFMAIDTFAKKVNLNFTKTKYNASIAEGVVNGKKVILLKPTTYMNLSGDCVSMVVKKLNIPLNQICVIYDDIDLEVGAIRFRKSGSAGTHNGMRDIVTKLKSSEFSRIRIGIGKPTDRPLVEYVLSRIPKENEVKYKDAFDKVADLVTEFIDTDGNIEGKSLN